MGTIKLSPVEARDDQGTVGVLFAVTWKRPNGHESRTYLAILGEHDIPSAVEWFASKVRATQIEYQPSLMFTWEWEANLENYLLGFNLRNL